MKQQCDSILTSKRKDSRRNTESLFHTKVASVTAATGKMNEFAMSSENDRSRGLEGI